MSPKCNSLNNFIFDTKTKTFYTTIEWIYIWGKLSFGNCLPYLHIMSVHDTYLCVCGRYAISEKLLDH